MSHSSTSEPASVRLNLADPDQPTRRRSWASRQGRRLLSWWAETPQRRYQAWVDKHTHRSHCSACLHVIRYWRTEHSRVTQCHNCGRWLVVPAGDVALDELAEAQPVDRIQFGLGEQLRTGQQKLEREVQSLREAVGWILGIMLLVLICSCLFGVAR